MDDEPDIYGLEPVPDPVEELGPVPQEVEEAVCKQCSYDLSGLIETGVCPECGLEIQRSLTEDYLEFSSHEYLKSLHIGVTLILAAIFVKTIILFSAIAIMFTMITRGGMAGLVMSALEILDLVASVMLGIGWWKFSALDPAYAGRLDGARVRKTVRITTLVVAGVAVISLPLHVMSNFVQPQALMAVISLFQWISFLAWATGFFAAMLYLRWLSPRFPNWWAYKRAKLLMWLGPILYTVGWLCIGLGPLVALILYWNMLNWIRLDLKMIRSGSSIAYRRSSYEKH
jgi:hypothetical protein